MRHERFGAMLALAAMLAGCGGDGGSSASTSSGGSAGGGTAATPAPTASGCSLRERQDWAAAQLREWYLFPETLPTSLSPAGYSTVDDYIDALTKTARDQSKDRYFTHLASIKEENAYYDSGESAGFGFRITIASGNSALTVTESFEGAPALAAGVDRGAQIVGIGTSSSDVRSIAAITAADPTYGIGNALGPDTTGTTRVFRLQTANGGTRDVSIAKAVYTLTPISSRYGVQIINDGDQKVGYLNLRTFINTADAQLRSAFDGFRQQGITRVIIDLRYNGGGLINTAELAGDLLGGNRQTSDVFHYTTFRPEKSSNNETRYFAPQSQSIAPTRIAFIGTRGTASASELLINAMSPYLGTSMALVGTNTYGKPVGQIALDRAQCDDRLRVVAIATQNSARQGGYYTGLASTLGTTCQASDDLSRPMGDPAESSTRAALDFLAGRSCTSITARSGDATSFSASGRELVRAARPSAAQREVPGLF